MEAEDGNLFDEMQAFFDLFEDMNGGGGDDEQPDIETETPIPLDNPDNASIPDKFATPVEVNNMVCKTIVGCTLPLAKLARQLPNCIYNPKKFPNLATRIRDPKATILLFSSGKCICTGQPSEHNVKRAFRKVRHQLQKLGYDVKRNPVTIENIVCQFEVAWDVNLEAMARGAVHHRFCEYNRDKFPGINYKMPLPGLRNQQLTLRIFSNGKVMIQAAKNMETVRYAMQRIIPCIYQYRFTTPIPVENPATLIK